jgi:NAD(P)-dependent dehydrogenase (short-subunit alcohol dehydrogenase family)
MRERMNRSIALVTGGNSGIGFECARQLAREGWHVVVASRDRQASADAVRRITRESGGDAASEMGLDLGSIASVRTFAKELEQRDLPFRALVCNAGLQVSSGLRRSPDGYELTFAVNHLGHFLLTNLLLARLLANAPARIVVVASGVHDPTLRTGMPKASVTDLDTLAATGGPSRDAFDGRLAYVNSKLCNLWFAYELVRRIEAAGLTNGTRPLTVNGYDPGLVPGSGLARDYPAVLRFVWSWILPGVARALTLVVPTINPASKSGKALARLVIDPALAGVSGKYFPSHSRWREAPSSDASYEAPRARDLWEASVRMTGLSPAESPLVQG